MEKNWKTAPWVVRLLIIYWLFPLVSTVLIAVFIAFYILETDPISIWRIPFDLFRVQYDAMPISTSIDLGVSIMFFSAAFYAWQLLRGSGTSRAVLEMFSWIAILFTSANLFFPGLRYLEVENISPSLTDIPISFLAVATVIFGLELAVLYMVRTPRVRDYANVF